MAKKTKTTERYIGDTNLVVVSTIYTQSQTSLLRDERGECVTLLAVRDTKTGQTGHIYHEIASDKRDIEEENFYTDTPELFRDNHPESYEIQELAGYNPNGDAATERTDAITAVIAGCIDECQLEYREGNQDGKDYDEKAWGLYVLGQ